MGCTASKHATRVVKDAIEPADGANDASSRGASSRGGGAYVEVADLPDHTFTYPNPPRRHQTTGGITTAILADFSFGNVLGTGGFAVVKEATHVRTKKRYAVKIMNVAKDGDADEGMTMDEIAEEIRLTMSIQHENIVKVYDFYQTKRIVYVIMELLEGGELLEAVMDLGSYQERDAACIMKQLFIGLESIHEKSMAHRDLKLENLILARPNDLNSVRIADFGLAKKMRNARGKLSAQCGSPAYVAPEVIAGQQYTPAVDMWAAGCIMYALLCGELPFYEEDEQAMYKRITRGKMHEPSEDISAAGMDLIKGLLDHDAVSRLTAVEALEHEWISGALSSKNLGMDKTINRSRMQRFAETKMGSDLETREYDPGDLLIRQGERAKEVFLIKEGTCEVVVRTEDGEEEKVAERTAGEFVGEMGVKTQQGAGVADIDTVSDAKIEDGGEKKGEKNKKRELSSTTRGVLNVATLLRVKNKWLGGRRGADVRAVTHMKVLVLSSNQMQWVLEHDYGVHGEMGAIINERTQQLEKSKSNRESKAAKAKQAPEKKRLDAVNSISELELKN
jgi:serine/threonine protein kinase